MFSLSMLIFNKNDNYALRQPKPFEKAFFRSIRQLVLCQKKIATELALPAPSSKTTFISILILGLIYPFARSYRWVKVQNNLILGHVPYGNPVDAFEFYDFKNIGSGRLILIVFYLPPKW